MALESFPKISPANFSPENDLIQVYSKKGDYVGVINPSYIGGSTSPSGVAGAIQFSNGSAFASDAANLFWDDTNNRLGIGTNAPTNTFEIASTSASPFKVATTASYFRATFQNSGASGILDFNSSNFQFPTNNVDFGTSTALGARVGIKGSGSTSATTSLLVQNSAGTAAMQVQDDLSCTLNSGNSGAVKFSLGANNININFIANNSGWGLLAGGGIRHYINSSESARLDANGSWVVGKGSNADASAISELTSTTKGFLPPRMTTTQKNAIATPAAGLVVYDSTTNKLCCYNGSTWNDLF